MWGQFFCVHKRCVKCIIDYHLRFSSCHWCCWLRVVAKCPDLRALHVILLLVVNIFDKNLFAIVLFINIVCLIPITQLFLLLRQPFPIFGDILFLAAGHVLVVLIEESLGFLRARGNLTVELSLWFVQSIFDDVLMILVNINRFGFENILLFPLHLSNLFLVIVKALE